MSTSKQNTLLFLAGTVLAACGPITFEPTEPVEEYRSINGVKLIRADITDPRAESTYSQSEYEVGPTSHLLMRLEDMVAKQDSISIAPNHPITVRIFLRDLTGLPTNTEVTELGKHLEICPVTKNWMMHATWLRAFPFSSAGNWSAPGGDFASPCSRDPVGLTDGHSLSYLTFNVTQWFLDYPRGRGIDNGLILRSDQAIRIYGDTSPSSSPRISFTRRY